MRGRQRPGALPESGPEAAGTKIENLKMFENVIGTQSKVVEEEVRNDMKT